MRERDRIHPAKIVAAGFLLTGGMMSFANESDSAGFATCAAYYFLAARGHGMQEYDRLYSNGERSFNEAAKRHGKAAADAKMTQASTGLMKEIHQDWRAIDILDKKYGATCEDLLRDAGLNAAD